MSESIHTLMKIFTNDLNSLKHTKRSGILKAGLLVFCFVLLSTLVSAQTYYSRSTGNLNLVASWSSNTNGVGGTSPANFATNGITYIIANRATATIDAAWTVSGTGSKVVVGDGTNAVNFTIPATFAYTGTIDVASVGTLSILNTTVPTLGTLNTNSTVEFSAAGAQAVASKTYSNLILEGSGTKTAGGSIVVDGVLEINGTATFAFANAGYVLSGGFTTAATGTGTLSTISTNASPIPTGKTWAFNVIYTSGALNIMAGTYNGNLTVSGTGAKVMTGAITVAGNFTYSPTSGSFTQNNATSNVLTIGGNMTVSGTGSYDFNSGNSGTSYIELAGNFSNGGTMLSTGGNVLNGEIRFTGTGTQTFTNTTPANITFVNYKIENGSTLSLVSTMNLSRNATAIYMGTLNILSGGTFITNLLTVAQNGASGTAVVNLEAGATFITSNATGITGALPGANITKTFNAAANYEFKGASTGTFPNATMNDLVINSGTTTVVTQNITVNGTLTINASNILNLSTFTLGGTISATSTTGTMRMQNASAIPTGRTWNFTVQYDGTAQDVVSGSYNNLTVSTAGTKTAAGTINVSGVLTVSAGVLDMGTNLLNSVGTTVGGGGILRTSNTAAAPLPTGKTWNMTVEYTGGVQNLMAGTYAGALTTTTAGIKTATGNFSVGGVFTITSPSVVNMGTALLTSVGTTAGANGLLTTANTSTTPLPAGKSWLFDVEYLAAANQTVMGGTYVDLVVSNAGTKTAAAAITVTTSLVVNSGVTLDMATFTALGNYAPTGGGLFRTAAATTAYVANKTWPLEVEYYSASAQSMIAGTYNGNLTITAGTNTASAATVVNSTLKIATNAVLNMSTFALTGATLVPDGDGRLITSNTSGTPIPTGKTWTFDVEFTAAGTSVQSIPIGTYNNLLITGVSTGARTPVGIFTVTGTFTLNATGTTTTNINLNNSNAQRTYNIANINIIDGVLDGGSGTVAATTVNTIINMSGSLTIADAGRLHNSSTAEYTTINFTGTGNISVGTTANSYTKVNTNITGTANVTLLTNLSTFDTGTTTAALTIDNTATFDASTFTVTAAVNGFTYNINGTFRTAKTTGFSGAAAAAISNGFTNTITPGANSTIEYYSTGQTITSRTYSNLMNTNGTNTAGGALTVNGKLTINPSSVINMSTNQLLGTITSTDGTGTLRIQNTLALPIPAGKSWSGTVLYDGLAQTIVQGDYTNISTSSAGVGNKTFAAGTTKVSGNWTTTGPKVDLTTNAVILEFNGSGAQAIQDAGTDGGNGIIFKNVNFTGGGTKTLSATGSGKFSVIGGASYGVLNVTGSSTLATGGLLTLKTDALGYGQIGNLSAGTVSGDVNVEIYFAGGYRTTRMVGSPVNDALTTNTFYENLKNAVFITGPGGAAAGFDVGTGVSPNALTIQTYNEPATMVQSQFTPLTSMVNTVRFSTNPGIGRGIMLFYRGDRTNPTGKFATPFATPESTVATFKGPINSGNITVTLPYSNNVGDTYNGYSVVSNPYPATIDLSQIERTSNVPALFRILKPAGGMITWLNGIVVDSGPLIETGPANSSSGNYPRIQPGQAFYVKADAAGQSITFRESHKSTALPAVRMLMAPVTEKLFEAMPGTPNLSASSITRVIKFNLKNDAYVDETAIVFGSEYSAAFDGDDAIYFSGTTVSLSTMSSDNVALAINFMPDISQVAEVRINFNATASGPVSLNFTNLQDLGTYKITLKDNYLNTLTDVKANPTYNFDVDRAIAATFGAGRFVLLFETGAVPLEIDLSAFTISQINNSVSLNWVTSTEKSSVKFEIERSADGVNFTKIGEVAGAGESTAALPYTFADNTPLSGTNHYRLKQIYSDETSSYSEIKTVTFTPPPVNVPKQNLKIFPNPTSDFVNIKVTGIRAQLIIYDLFGRKVKTTTFAMNENIKQDVSNLFIGIYLAEVKDLNTGKVIDRMLFIKKR